MKKHAYLIICHNNFEILKYLLQAIDDERNDIYLHIDKKVKAFPYQQFQELVRKSNLYFTRRVSVTWGGFSQIRAELILLKASMKRKYAYYHLLSGVDFPLQTQDYIHQFFDDHETTNFISYEENPNQVERFIPRIKWYYLWQERIGRDKGCTYGCLQHKFLKLQKRIGIDRTKNSPFQYQYGSNWFSITHSCAELIIKKERLIKKYFSKSVCADELFLQTIILNSPLRDTVVNDNKRLIDWKRGRPYTFTSEDYEELIQSNKFFARKFDFCVDFDITQKLYGNFRKENSPNIDKQS